MYLLNVNVDLEVKVLKHTINTDLLSPWTRFAFTYYIKNYILVVGGEQTCKIYFFKAFCQNKKN